VHPGGTTRVANALIKANKRFDLVILPGQRHGYADMTEYFFWRMADYFTEYLMGDKTERFQPFIPLFSSYHSYRSCPLSLSFIIAIPVLDFSFTSNAYHAPI
jgi:hypothetical protein